MSQRTTCRPCRPPKAAIADPLTCVIDTGNPSGDATPTNTADVTLALSVSARGNTVTRSASVSVTRRPATQLPAPMAVATTTNSQNGAVCPTPTVANTALKATIFGASFSPLANPAPAVDAGTARRSAGA